MNCKSFVNTAAPSSDIQTWVIPTIIISLLMIAAIALILVLRIRDYIKKKRKVTYSNQYGREDAYEDIERMRAQIENDKQNDQAAKSKPQRDDDAYEETPAMTDDGEKSEPAYNAEPEAKEQPEKSATEQPKKSDDDLDD